MTIQADDAALRSQDRRAVARLQNFCKLNPFELDLLKSMAEPPRRLKRGDLIRYQDQASGTLDLLLDGWAASAIGLASGSRQLVSVNLAGDLLGLAGVAVASPIDSVVALSAVEVSSVPEAFLAEMFAQAPRLAAVLFLVSQEERAMAMERLALLGQFSARSRLAALFIRLGERLALLGLGSPTKYDLPLTQQDLADLIGVTTVHLNGTLQNLRGDGIISLEHRQLRVLDFETLSIIAQIEPWQTSAPEWLNSLQTER